ncbi:DUF596 domain-containing protein [Brenneria rubrifaciens]|uniref:DUF596 domain-containing protein n=1 Tax=Brenneria rubrifaciens TaxID=55213 RepID=A0A4P8QWX3_9GAMM|nr:DUF596 domain-containing protein [Brenneria rubrifaciens]QCR10100.1 DUF596 domain-containing protein [Brenneria rubrifaciens]
MYISDEEYQEYKELLEGHALSGVWWVTPPDEYDEETFTYENRKAFFLILLQRLMEDGKVRLAKHDKFLEGSIEEQIERYKQAFPKTEEEWKAKHEEVWFFHEECPGGAVWVLDDGYLDWT